MMAAAGILPEVARVVRRKVVGSPVSGHRRSDRDVLDGRAGRGNHRAPAVVEALFGDAVENVEDARAPIGEVVAPLATVWAVDLPKAKIAFPANVPLVDLFHLALIDRVFPEAAGRLASD